MDRQRAKAADDRARRPSRGTSLAQAAVLLGAAAVVWLTISVDRWSLGPLLVLSAFTIVSTFADVSAGVSRITIAGFNIGLMVAIVVLGAGRAAALGAATMMVSWLRTRTPGHFFLNNLIVFSWFPLASGLFFHAAIRLGNLDPHQPAFYLLIFVTFIVGLALNFVGVFGYVCYLDGSSMVQRAREAVLPVMSAQLFSALLTMAAAYIAVEAGTVGIALTVLVLLVFQYLVGELVKSKQRGDQLELLATTDELTGLANRERFRERLDRRIATARATEDKFAVMLLDLDRFKEVNDTLGHHYGDELLRDLGPRLAEAIGPDGLVARLGGDEFAVLPAESTDDTDELQAVAQRLINCVQRPMLVDEMTLEVGVSIGVARFPRDGHDPHSLLRSADVAMYAAKEAHAGCKLYAAALERHSVRRLSVMSEVRRALVSDEIVVFYQPIMHADGIRPRGAEGLVRWQHPTLGLVSPMDFLPVVEQTRLIMPLTRHVLEQAIEQCASWRRGGHTLTVSVNLSVRNLLDPDLPSTIGSLLSLYGLAPEALQLEITESMLMSDPERSLVTLMRLNQLGVGLSVDDYGTGYSSLANLRRLPIDELKIDRSFVSPMLSDESDLIIVRSTINLGHDLGLNVVAEGVEDEGTLHRLAGLGCDFAQGYHFSRPLAPAAFNEWVDARAALREPVLVTSSRLYEQPAAA